MEPVKVGDRGATIPTMSNDDDAICFDPSGVDDVRRRRWVSLEALADPSSVDDVRVLGRRLDHTDSSVQNYKIFSVAKRKGFIRNASQTKTCRSSR